jgi:hypothetical protein
MRCFIAGRKVSNPSIIANLVEFAARANYGLSAACAFTVDVGAVARGKPVRPVLAACVHFRAANLGHLSYLVGAMMRETLRTMQRFYGALAAVLAGEDGVQALVARAKGHDPAVEALFEALLEVAGDSGGGSGGGRGGGRGVEGLAPVTRCSHHPHELGVTPPTRRGTCDVCNSGVVGVEYTCAAGCNWGA